MSYSHQKGFSWVQLIVCIFVIFIVAGILAPPRIKKARAGDRTKALSNAKTLAAGLMAFKAEYGAYPFDGTRKQLEKEGVNHLPQGDSANAYFAQLLASGILESEKLFFGFGMTNFREGDDVMDSTVKILDTGENGFAYIMAPDGKPLTDTRSFTPLLLAPIKTSGPEPIFDPGPYGGKFVMGLADGSSSARDIDENGHAVTEGRDNFFQAGRDSLFGSDIPVVKYPLGL